MAISTISSPYAITSPGSVLQVVQATNNTQVTLSSNTFVNTGISASITPKFSTSKILARFIISGYTNASARGYSFALYRGATQVWLPGAVNSGGGYGSFYASGGDAAATIPIEYLDSPATTSSTTYAIYANSYNGNTTTLNIASSPNPGQTSIILMEIAG